MCLRVSEIGRLVPIVCQNATPLTRLIFGTMNPKPFQGMNPAAVFGKLA